MPAKQLKDKLRHCLPIDNNKKNKISNTLRIKILAYMMIKQRTIAKKHINKAKN
jgi:hypothetical protein